MEKKDSFKDTISIVNSKGKRKWVYAKKPSGKYYRARTIVSIFLLIFLFGMPFIKKGGHPFLLFDIVNRHFIFFGMVFTPQDFYLFGLLMITIFISLFLVTAVFGRIFCGWICPQTIFLEMVFRKIEYIIEGDFIRQKELDNSNWSVRKIIRKGVKYFLFFVISFIIANTFLSYIIGIDELKKIITEPVSMHATGFTWIMVFTGMFYFVFAWFREQACILVCPYGRLQSVLLDKNSIVIAYDYVRGEPRGKVKQKEEKNLGDCIDCKQCVMVCPTGIDIRNGTQLECVNCTACIDACDDIMEKVKRPRGLIRFDSMEGIENKIRHKFTPRIIGYCSVLLILILTMSYLFARRKEIDVSVLRTPGTLFQNLSENKISNLYNLKISNKTFDEIPLKLILNGSDGEIKLTGNEITLKPLEIYEGSFLVIIPKEKIRFTNTPIKINILSGEKILLEEETTFLGTNK